MGRPSFAPKDLPIDSEFEAIKHKLEVDGVFFEITAVSMGNPHCIIFDTCSDFKHWGSLIENHAFFPERTNVEFVTVLNPKCLKVDVWERGAGATLACGTGACAVLAAAHKLGLAKDNAEIQLPGGSLLIEFKDSKTMFMTGSASLIAMGDFSESYLGLF
jgi:diaminopimelate epimerase